MRRALMPTPAAKTVHVRNGKAPLTDGLFAETRDQLGGYHLLEAEEAAAKVGVALLDLSRSGPS